MTSCQTLSRSVEHEIFRVFSEGASRKGVMAGGITEATRLANRSYREVFDAIEVLLDLDLLERLAAGTYRVKTACRCKPQEVFETILKPPPKPAAGDEYTASKTQLCEFRTTGLSSVVREGVAPRRLSRSGSKNRWEQKAGRYTEAQRLFSLAATIFPRTCEQNGIPNRDFHYPALLRHLKVWNKEGVSTNVLEEMIQIFGHTPWDSFGSRSVAWRLFISRRQELERKARSAVGDIPAPSSSFEATLEAIRKDRQDPRQFVGGN